MVTFTDKSQINNILFFSRRLMGTERFENLEKTIGCIELCQPSLITVAIRRLEIPQQGRGGLLTTVNWKQILMVPNTAGSKTPDRANPSE